MCNLNNFFLNVMTLSMVSLIKSQNRIEKFAALMSESALNFLRRIRAPIAHYQEPKGVSKFEKYSFPDLIHALCQEAYNAIATILTMLYNTMPLFEGFMFMLRFMLDKSIDIFETQDTKDRVMKSLIFSAELVILFILLYFITSFLLLPIAHFTILIINKIVYAAMTP